MPHFLINKNFIDKDIVTVVEPNLLKHLVSSLRIKENESVKFIDDEGIVYISVIRSISKKEITAQVKESYKSARFLKHNIYLSQSVLKSDAQNLLISNAVQAGVKAVIPFISDFSAVKKEAVINKTNKWQKIADEAFKQCERAERANIFNIQNLEDIIKNFHLQNIVVFSERESCNTVYDFIQNADLQQDILVIIGPEGGFSEREFAFFNSKNIKEVTLGPLIYKAPNAVVAGISNLVQAIEINKQC